MATGDTKTTEKSPQGYQFGTFKGVFTPSILTILGVIMYLRFGWALGNVGLTETLLIVTLASAITFLTALSLSALATNMKVEGGGAYYIISRSLGIEAGAAVGVPLFFAQALGISFYILGFSESLVTEFPSLLPEIASFLHLPDDIIGFCDVYYSQIVGIMTLLLLTGMAYKSADLVLKSQFVIMVIIAVSLLSFFCGGEPSQELVLPAYMGERVGFWAVFAVIFPAVTGIEAGIAMSGDLKDPKKSLPRGTMAAVLLGYVVYVAVVLFLWSVVQDRDMLASHPMMMRYVARWGGPVLLGIWAASLSSAMGALLGAPRTLQALARDKVIPRMFARGFGPGNEPRIATATALVVAAIGIVAGDLNVIAPVLSMFFLTSYGLLNVSAGLEELTGPPSWRPKFRIPWIISIAGAVGCFGAMLMIHVGATFMAAFVAFAIFFIMEKRKLTAWWGDMRSGILMLIARHSIHGLAKRRPDERTWKPNILVLSGSPTKRWNLIELASAISQDRGFLTLATIVPEDMTVDRTRGVERTVTDYLEKRDVAAIVKVYPAENPLVGARTLIKAYGYGPIAPNTMLLGTTEEKDHYHDYCDLILTAHAQKHNLLMVRESDMIEDEEHKRERIDLWWYGTQQNLGLMLALVYLLKKSPGWRSAETVIKTIVDDDSQVEEMKNRLDSFIEKVRLDAQSEVITKSGNDIFTDIKKHSDGSDLVFMGIRAPQEDEDAEQYAKYYEALLEKTSDMPPVAFVLAAEEMDFYSIFNE
jgi:amino acid transporter